MIKHCLHVWCQEAEARLSDSSEVLHEMSRLLERLQGLETASTGDHEVLQQLSRDRLLLERRKWLEVSASKSCIRIASEGS